MKLSIVEMLFHQQLLPVTERIFTMATVITNNFVLLRVVAEAASQKWIPEKNVLLK